jgi:hypothetical protein
MAFISVRPEHDHVVLRGSTREAADVVIKGTVALKLRTPLHKASIRIVFSNKAKYGMPTEDLASPTQHESHLINTRWTYRLNLAVKQSLNEGILHIFPFEFPFEGKWPASVEGFRSAWFVWRLKAVVEHGRLLQKNWVAKKHIRIIRTFLEDSVEMQQSMVSHNNAQPEVTMPISNHSLSDSWVPIFSFRHRRQQRC